MNFFKIILISCSHSPYWIHLYGVPNIPVPFHLLLLPYSILRIQYPKNVYPNIFSSNVEIQFAKFVKFFLSFSSQYHLHSASEHTLCAYEHDLCSPLLSISEYPHYCISVSANRDIVSELHLPALCNDTWYTKLYVRLTYLWCDFQSYFPSIKNREICRNYKSCTESA